MQREIFLLSCVFQFVCIAEKGEDKAEFTLLACNIFLLFAGYLLLIFGGDDSQSSYFFDSFCQLLYIYRRKCSYTTALTL